MKQQYIEWIYPGSLFAESSSQKTDIRVVPSTIPARAVGYRFFARQEVEHEGETLAGKAVDYSGWTYFGDEFTVDQIKAMADHRHHILISNLELNGYARAVRTIDGNWYQLLESDHVDQALTAVIRATHAEAGHA